jgi:hypothetical protein
LRKREPYASVTFTPSEETRKKLIEMKRATGRSISNIVQECVTNALRTAELPPAKKDLFLESRALGQSLERLIMEGLRHQLRAQIHKSLDVKLSEDLVEPKLIRHQSTP